MKKYLVFALLVSTILSCKKDLPKKDFIVEGISYELAKYRKNQVKKVHYNLEFEIPEEKIKPILAKVTVQAIVLDLNQDLILDFNEEATHIKSVKVNGKSIEIDHQKEHLIIAKEHLIKEKNSIQIDFIAGELSLNRNEDYLYTLLVPDRASTLFPCFDQPNIKATYNLTVTAPKDWQVLCGGFEEDRIDKGAFIKHVFAKTEAMSTYLFSFVAGEFEVVKKNPGAFDMTFLYRETNKEKKEESIDEVFSIHQKAISFLEEYTQYEFPFQKMDFAAIPGFQYGGMEHVGAIQYRQSSLFLDKTATQNRKLNRAKLIAHETSHMWFGDLVTMQWFDDVWMKEVFANFMADKIMNPVFPNVNHDLQFMLTHYPSAYSEDRTKGTNPIKQHLENLKNAGSLYGRIIYNKAPIMMRQLESLLGKEAFKEGMQEYIETYANGNADWNDLVSILDDKSKEDVKKWSEVWVNKSGRPIISEAILYEDNVISEFVISQKAEDGTDKIWPQTFTIALVYDNEIKEVSVDISAKKMALDEVVGWKKPNQIIYNYNGFGYGIFPQKNIKNILEIQDPVARGYGYINAFEKMLHGDVAPIDLFSVCLKGTNKENNELILNRITSTLRTVFWEFLTEEQRVSVQKETEKTLFNSLNKKENKAEIRNLFNAYKAIAYSSEGKNNLYAIWSDKLIISGLQLNVNDYISLASTLAIYKHDKSEVVLEETKIRIKNNDRLHRYNWLLPSLSNNIEVRDAFFNQLKEESFREKESWVQSALSNLHHPLRQKESIKYLKDGLYLLQEIQLTGDIFFPKGWLNNSVNKYTSKEAFSIVDAFLKEHQEYNPILKNKILQTVDNLYRAQKIK